MNVENITFSYPKENSKDFFYETFTRDDINEVKKFALKILKNNDIFPYFNHKKKTNLPFTFSNATNNKILLIGKIVVVAGGVKKLRFGCLIDLVTNHEQKTACLKMKNDKLAEIELENISLLRSWKINGIVQTMGNQNYIGKNNIEKTLIIQDLCENGDLHTNTSRSKSLTGKKGQDFDKKVCSWFLQIAKTFSILHSKGYVYRDLKPDNILIEKDKCLLADFYSITKAKSYSSSGTRNYLPPEIYLCVLWESSYEQKISTICQTNVPAWDIWCFGETLFSTIFGGRSPYSSRITKRFEEKTPLHYNDYTEEKTQYYKDFEKAFTVLRREFLKQLYDDSTNVENTLHPENIEELIAMMQHFEPEKRPTDDDIVKILEDLYEKLPEAKSP